MRGQCWDFAQGGFAQGGQYWHCIGIGIGINNVRGQYWHCDFAQGGGSTTCAASVGAGSNAVRILSLKKTLMDRGGHDEEGLRSRKAYEKDSEPQNNATSGPARRKISRSPSEGAPWATFPEMLKPFKMRRGFRGNTKIRDFATYILGLFPRTLLSATR